MGAQGEAIGVDGGAQCRQIRYTGQMRVQDDFNVAQTSCIFCELGSVSSSFPLAAPSTAPL
jgi:hypothetical protein